MSNRVRSARPLSASLLAVKGAARPAQDSAVNAAVYGGTDPSGNTPQNPPQMPKGPDTSAADKPAPAPSAQATPSTQTTPKVPASMLPPKNLPQTGFGQAPVPQRRVFAAAPKQPQDELVKPAQSVTPKVGTSMLDLKPAPDQTEAPAPKIEVPAPKPEGPARELQRKVLQASESEKPAPKASFSARKSPPKPTKVDAEFGKKAAFTFRMGEQRHFRLRLLSAHQNRSSQKIMEDALDAYLEAHAPQSIGEGCACYDSSQELGGR